MLEYKLFEIVEYSQFYKNIEGSSVGTELIKTDTRRL